MDLKKLARLTEKKVQNITAQEIEDIFPVITKLEGLMLSRAIRNETKVELSEYYKQVGQVISAIVYRVKQEQVVEVTDEVVSFIALMSVAVIDLIEKIDG